MRLHSDTITRDDIDAAARLASVKLLQCDVQVSRKRKGAYEITLGGCSKSRTQRFRTDRAATYRQWGVFLAALFDVDPEAVAGDYRGFTAFHAITRHEFSDGRPYSPADDPRAARMCRPAIQKG